MHFAQLQLPLSLSLSLKYDGRKKQPNKVLKLATPASNILYWDFQSISQSSSQDRPNSGLSKKLNFPSETAFSSSAFKFGGRNV